MDCKKLGKLINELRRNKDMTQLVLANKLNVSDKTISKWERGMGCPDISTVGRLSEILGIDLKKMLLGDLSPNKYNRGNMKLVDFYYCKNCNNIMFGLNDVELSCCGITLKSLEHKTLDENHKVKITEIENDYFIEINHPMTKDHYINFVAYVLQGGITLLRLYPKQSAEIRIPKQYKMDIFISCNKDGLFKVQ